VFRHRLDAVPVHVEHRHGERQVLLVEAVEQLEIAVGAVAVVAAPPVAEHPAGQHRRPAGDGEERVERGLVVVAVGEDVDVDAAVGARADPAVVLEQERARVVERGHAASARRSPDRARSGRRRRRACGGAAEVVDGSP
jgi:hypothetical protein